MVNLSRRETAIVIVNWLLGGRQNNRTKKPLLVMPTDEMIRQFCTPLVDAGLRDPKLRRSLNTQMDRVIGKKKLRQWAYLTLLDEKPQIKRYPRIHARIKRELGA